MITIVTGQDCSPAEKKAAEIISRTLKKSGKRNRVLNESRYRGTSPAIILGTPESCSLVSKYLNQRRIVLPGKDGFLLTQDKGDSVYLMSNLPRGCVYGAFSLEDDLKFSRGRLLLTRKSIKEEPSFEYRVILDRLDGRYGPGMHTHIEEYGLRKLMLIGAIIAVAGFVMLLILGLSLGINQKNKMPFVLLFLPLLTIVLGLIGFMLLSQPLMADCIDHDEVLTGKRRETTYAGVNALITKPAVSIGHALFLIVIALYGYDESIKDPAKQSLSVATGVIVAFTLIPIICMIIGIIALYFYPLDDDDWKEQKLKLQEIHKQKEKEYVEWLKRGDPKSALEEKEDKSERNET